jgi:selenium metabolism protein YedF
VTRIAEKAGATVAVARSEDGTYLTINRTPGAAPVAATQLESRAPAGGPLVLVVPSEYMGRGEPELGHILMRGFFHTLGEVAPLPDVIIFLNGGVKLVAEGSPVLEDVQALCTRGVEVLACGTCLGYHELKDRVAAGEISNMYTIAETMLSAGKVITL